MTMIAVGVDGATWDVILPNVDQLPHFKHLVEHCKFGILECDVRPVHSAPSWTTIFTGLKPDRHGVLDFVLEKSSRAELLGRNLFLWQRVKDAVCLDIPVAFPPLNSGVGLKEWDRAILSVTEEEMFDATKTTLDLALQTLRKTNPAFFSVVFYETDRASHFFWKNPEKLLAHYQSCDRALGALMPYLEDPANDFLVLSDHGFCHAALTKAFGWDKIKNDQPGGHHPNGIAISKRDPPKRISDVYDFMTHGLTSL